MSLATGPGQDQLPLLWLLWLQSELRIKQTLARKYEIISKVFGEQEPSEDEFSKLRELAKTAAHAYDRVYSYDDGLAMFDLTLYYQDWEYMESSMVPTVLAQFSRMTAFMLGFTQRWRESMRRGQITSPEAHAIYVALIEATIEHMPVSIHSARTSVHDKNGATPQDELEYEKQRIASIKYFVVYQFAKSLADLTLANQFGLFMEKIRTQLSLIQSHSFHSLWLPLLQDLLPVFEKRSIDLTFPPLQKFYQEILTRYLQSYVGTWLPAVYGRPFVGCGCTVCQTMVNFHFNASEPVWHFPFRAYEPHLREAIEAQRYECVIKSFLQPHTKEPYVAIIKGDIPLAGAETREERRRMAAKQLSGFDQEKLRGVLGQEYEGILSLQIVQIPGDEPVSLGLSSIPQVREPLIPISADPSINFSAAQASVYRPSAALNDLPKGAGPHSPVSTKKAGLYLPTSSKTTCSAHSTTTVVLLNPSQSPSDSLAGGSPRTPLKQTYRQTSLLRYGLPENSRKEPTDRTLKRPAPQSFSQPECKKVEIIDLTLDD
ncbi:hypothetical protein F5Y16DRAFT_365603, partial [Xylariaceae sp. FL0255]